MLQFTQGNTTQRFVVTLNEKKTLTAPYYLFVFYNVVTKNTVSTVINSTADLSLYPERFNKFQINVATLFASQNNGDWQYNVYEQASSTNTIVASSGAKVETGKMRLNASTEFAFETYNPSQSFKAYQG